MRRSRSINLVGNVYLLALAVSALIACRPVDPELFPPEEIIQRSAARMASLSGLHFVIDRSGAPAYLDSARSIVFRRAEGDYVAPDRAQATVRIIAPGIVADVQIRTLENRYWETDFISGTWLEFPLEQGFNPAILFNPQTGFQTILTSDLKDLRLRGLEELEELPGQTLYAVEGKIESQRISELSYGLIAKSPGEIIIWVSPESFDIQRVIITIPSTSEAEPTIWQLDFWNFDQAPNIIPPIVDP